MSSSKGSSSSSKTAHVMNLLRKSAPPAAAPAGESDGQPAAAPAVSAGQIPPILSSLNADAQISAEIKGALEQALDEEIAASADAAHEPVPARQDESVVPPLQPEPEQPAAAPSAEAEPQPAQEPAPEEPIPEEPVPEEPVPEEPVPEEPVPEEPVPEEPTLQTPVSNAEEQHADASFENACQADAQATVLVNVMQQLTEERADKYIDLFGLCSCQQCRGDVIALSLNRLSPKYVVTSPTELTVRMDMYGNRYNSEITAQILRACKEVMEHPRHSN